jgi:hypothetical protein
MYRHGDVLIAPTTEEVPSQARVRPTQTLAWGEVTGHSHRIAEAGAAEVVEAGSTLFLRVLAPQATLVHEEHKPIVLSQGLYRVWFQREYTPRAILQVRD